MTPVKTDAAPSLFDPITIGGLVLPNRVLMAPLTRGRGTMEHVPTELMGEYYAQRAGAGLILSEATGISKEGLGWPFAPGLWTEDQVEGWKPVVERVHAAGGRIFAQLWHMGRLVHPDMGGGAPVSSVAVAADGQAHTYSGKQDYATPRALPASEIPRVIGDYVTAARNAMRAGFDGVQIHAANGYLIDQFLRDTPNDRDDDYGGSADNRVRLLREVTAAVAGEVGADRTAVRLSPNGVVQSTNDSDPVTTFTTAAKALDALGIAFLEMREPREASTFAKTDVAPVSPHIRKAFSPPLFLNSDYGLADGQGQLDKGLADGIAYGRPYIANPDLVERFKAGAALNEPNPRTFYSQGPEGYTDYPAMEAAPA
ncbi:alkene reductase [Sphingorhabdus soli]|uniref:Alkene reductase n=1 Tax=Flavisphingopyxis soli TaxID=2601267 RepID=A0A5C6UKM0_9SPHN|nr:alkene reductase [Sphingorhabdus soli]TXC73339.1 alkene reductase [Sphingorhabdus soli]